GRLFGAYYGGVYAMPTDGSASTFIGGYPLPPERGDTWRVTSYALDARYLYTRTLTLTGLTVRTLEIARVPRTGGALEVLFESEVKDDGTLSSGIAVDGESVYFVVHDPDAAYKVLAIPKSGGEPTVVHEGTESIGSDG